MEYSRDDDYNFIKWAQAVKNRDFFTCQICKAYGIELNSHHLNGWNWCIEERYDVDNGITLCKKCHERFHEIYGRGYNTYLQFIEFKKFSKIFVNLINKKIIRRNIISKIVCEVTKTAMADMNLENIKS